MSVKGYYAALARCPFYIRDDPHAMQITCEGAMPESRNKSQFLSKEAWHDHIESYCRAGYSECPVYEMLLRAWEESEDDLS